MAGSGQSPSARQEVQKYEVRITQEAYDILVDEGLIDSASDGGVTLFDVQNAIVLKEEQGEVTSSAKTVLNSIGDNQAGTSRTVNGTNQSSGSSVGLGAWVGTFSGSCDIYRQGSGFSVFHFTEFSGALSASTFEFGGVGGGTDADYGTAFIGAPSNIIPSASLGTDPTGKYLKAIPFSGSFECVGSVSAGTFHTAESGSASGSRVFNEVTSSNQVIPDSLSEYNPKWVSGSFNGMGYTSSLGTTLFTSSAVTTLDLNNMSASSFVGSICVARGGFTGNSTKFSTTDNGGNIFNGGKSLSATIESAFTLVGLYGSQYFRNSGSLSDNDNTGALISGLLGGTIFAISPSGSGTAPNGEDVSVTVSGSIESIESSDDYSNRGPGKPYVDGTAKKSYFKTKRTVSVTGAIDKFQKKAQKDAATSKFSPR